MIRQLCYGLAMNTTAGPAIVLSHTGVRAVCDHTRNADDETLKHISRAGGLIGVGLFGPALCGDDWVVSFVKTVQHVANLTGGVDAIAVGSDWDGSVEVVVPSDRTDVLARALLSLGNFSEEEVQQILYVNALRYFQNVLPASS